MEHGTNEVILNSIEEYVQGEGFERSWYFFYVDRHVLTYPETRCPDLGDASDVPHDQLDDTISAQWMNWDGKEIMVHVVQPYHREELSYRFGWHTFTWEKRDFTSEERVDRERLLSYITD